MLLYVCRQRGVQIFRCARLPLHLIGGVGVIQQRGEERRGVRPIRGNLPLPSLSVYLRGDRPLFRRVKSMHHRRLTWLASPRRVLSTPIEFYSIEPSFHRDVSLIVTLILVHVVALILCGTYVILSVPVLGPKLLLVMGCVKLGN